MALFSQSEDPLHPDEARRVVMEKEQPLSSVGYGPRMERW